MKKPKRPSGKVANSLVAASAAAVMSVYAAGYVRTRDAANGLEAQSEERRPAAVEAGRAAAAVVPEAASVNASGVASAGPGQAVARERTATTPEAESAHAGAAGSGIPAAVAASEPAEQPLIAYNRQGDLPPAPVVEALEQSRASSIDAVPVGAPAPVAALAPVPVPGIVPAPVPVAAPAPTPAVKPASQWKDGTYTGWGTSRHGDIQAEVVVEGGRIQSATIADCRTRYPCSVIRPLPPEVAQRQSAEIDYVSGATQSTDAFYHAVLDALSKAK